MRKFDDIIPPSRRKEVQSAPIRTRQNKERRASDGRFPFITLGITLVIVAASVAALFHFSSAKIKITPNAATVTIDAKFTATPSGDVPFRVITVRKTASTQVAGSGSKTVATFASGQITISNTQSKPQSLVATTRFATENGLIFRIKNGVTVPGGTTAKPGTLVVTVYADKPGDAYNIGPSSFTLPGFAGTPQATQVYARSTSPMTGGASGTVPVAEASAEAAARASLSSQLIPELETALSAQLPPGYVLISGAATSSFAALPSAVATTQGMVEVREEGTMRAVVFPEAALAKAVAQAATSLNYQGQDIRFTSSSGLTIVPSGAFPADDAESFTFSLSGTASLIYVIDQNRISAAIAGKSRQDARTALGNYPEINTALLLLRPFWRTSFPKDPSAISVEVLHPSI